MPDVSWSLQVALKTRLDAQTSITWHDDVLPGTEYPYGVIGDESADRVPTLTTGAHERLIALTVFSDYQGKKEAKNLLQEAQDALDQQALTLTAGRLIDLLVLSSNVTRDTDGRTYTGSMLLRARTQ